MEQHDSATRLAELMYNRRPQVGLSSASSNSAGGFSNGDQPAISSRDLAQDFTNAPAAGLQGQLQGQSPNGLQHAGKKLKRDQSPASQSESVNTVLQRQR